MVLAAAAVISSLLSACTLGQASSFRGRAEASCRQIVTAASERALPKTNVDRLAYALDRYSDMDRVVAEVSSDISFPGGQNGRQLRDQWIDPARRSLRAGWDDLNRLREAIRSGPAGAIGPAYAAALQAGTVGVDRAGLRSDDLSTCATAFTAPSPPVD
jgi:hypothetical protein